MLGFHVSISGSIDLAVDRALELDCTTFQIFTRNPRGWAFKPLADEETKLFKEKRKRAGFGKVVAHMPYLPNLATSDPGFQKKSRASLAAEVKRCSVLGIDLLVAHIGSHMGAGTMTGVRNVAAACSQALEADPGDTVLLVETMAGQSKSVGSRFEELRMILDGVKDSKRFGVCMDTCHVFAAGFDISSRSGVERTMGLFDETVGMERLKVVHLNDSLGPLGAHLDRHEHLGMGQIGEEGLGAFLRYGSVAELPIIMEVPIDDRRKDAENLALARLLIRRAR